MTKRITELQRQLLKRAAGKPITDAATVDSGVSNSLINKKLVIWLPAEGGGSRLIVTQAGLAALAAAGSKKACRKDKAGGTRTPKPRARPNGQSESGKPAIRAPADTNPPDPAPAVPGTRLPTGKLGLLATLLKRPDGASVEEMMQATGWQAHSVRGAMLGGLKKKLGLTIKSEKTDTGRVYRIAAMAGP
jgi:Protein of unknown function (DUF3489)